MNYKLLLSVVSLISATNAASCWSNALGYECCKGCTVIESDASGDWGIENNQWCGIPSSCKANNTGNTSCWSKSLGYDCCKECNTVYTDGDGDWGFENNQWCGISDSCKSTGNDNPGNNDDKPNDEPPSNTNDPFNPTNNLATSPITDKRKRVGQTTRYWDCCKPSCAWNYKAKVTHEVYSCRKDGSIEPVVYATSGCGGGQAFMCNDQQPWEINDKLSYGFAAANISGSDEEHWCCACFKLTFTSTSIAGKQMIVQVTNTGGDLGNNHFDIQMPGGGLGLFDGCSPQFGVDASKWGNKYGGLTSESQCSLLPKVLQPGCHWRYGWFEDADNPAMEFEEVQCPQELVDITGCARLA
ncbi:hypothetical protein BCR32DRAFT_294130 [Anaeromyces robustus]|jgi:hypothetical protein|uniref:Cellulase n=1 Tax=Anaeromyces robustus TaxID=1754192 RepID=A0A1Y1X2J1_9FUNG|nr:hypothetical protein BCR32DRAFT_294130 [Anaeromyces robustus]|eukprot:ORX79922.1 hypothetical protein BCR32DRAFT_294130 [Anaeromyces robustus]